MADWNGYIMDISKQFDQGVDKATTIGNAATI